MPIALETQECLKSFNTLIQASHCDFLEAIEDTQGRFRIWVESVSAHTTGLRSLEYRLRDSSELASTVENYLHSLRDTLTSAMSALDGEATDDETATTEQDIEDAQLFNVDEINEGESTDRKSLLLEELNNIITCLFRISIALRNPLRSDLIRYAKTTSTEHFQLHDIAYIRKRFPKAETFLVERLGRAISRHRQYFRYREEHHQKLAAGLDDAHKNTADQMQITVATSTRREPQAPAPTKSQDEEWVHTARSFVPTITGKPYLRLPSRPLAATDGLPFQCPFCFCIIEAPDNSSWRDHVYDDIPPYMCIHEHCTTPTRQYSTRQDWQHHVKSHVKDWTCPFKCPQHFDTEERLCEHFRPEHKKQGDNDVLAMNAFLFGEFKDSSEQDKRCPFCWKTKDSEEAMTKHVGQHMENLVLFALPVRVYDTSDEKSEFEPADNEFALDEAYSSSDPDAAFSDKQNIK